MTIFCQILFLTATYLVCGIPFGLIITKFFAKKDIRQYGSGNIGATNVARIAGKKLGLITLLLDGLKGAIMIIIGRYLFADLDYRPVLLVLIGMVAVLGHVFPIYFRFRGGKGVATTMAILLAINPIIGGVACLSWLITFLISRISALASLTSVVVTMIFVICFQRPLEEIFLILFLMIIIFIRHRENIARMLSGQEQKL